MNQPIFDRDAMGIEALDRQGRAEVLSAYLDGELGPVAARHVTAWLDAHPDALREMEHDRRVWDLLALYGDEAVPAGFAGRILAEARSIAHPEAATARSGVLRLRPRPLLAAAAVLLLAVGTFFLAAPGPVEAPAPPAEVAEAVADVPAEYLEEVDVLLNLSDEEFEAYLLADLEEPWEDG